MIFVAFATATLDLGWIPTDADVVVVHNDDELARGSTGAGVTHLGSGRNIGFGAAVNLALQSISTSRVVLCNPDVSLDAQHWDALVDAGPDDVVTVPLVARHGRPTAVTSAYPTPASHLLSGYRVGRFVPRGGRLRTTLARGLGTWGRAHEESLRDPVGAWPLRDRWISGAVMSVDTARLRAVGGFDDGYFLYYEDVDLCARVARRFPSTRAIVADVPPGVHDVGQSATRDRQGVERLRCDSAIRYARGQQGPLWRTCEMVLRAGREVAR